MAVSARHGRPRPLGATGAGADPGGHPDVVLRRARIAVAEAEAEAEVNAAKGRILEPERPFVLYEEELPDGGLRITRRYQPARSADGGVHLWVGRRKQPSGGPMKRTPLRFDPLTGFDGER